MDYCRADWKFKDTQKRQNEPVDLILTVLNESKLRIIN